MSRTRIVKGKITEIIEKDYNMYSESNIVDNAAEIISDKGEAKGESYGNPEKPSAGEITAECMVQFRPHANWSGEYGFDWVRSADTGQIGDKIWYKNIIGKYKDSATKVLQQIDYNGKFYKDSSEYQKLLNKFNNMMIPWKAKIAEKTFLYPVPYMSIYKGETNKLSLKIEIGEVPKKLSIRHKKLSTDKITYFKFNRTEISIKKGKYTLDNFLEITCLRSFTTDQIIEVLADDIVCGKLKILANDIKHQKNGKILFISVKSSSAPGKINIGSTSGESERLKKYMKQAYINLDILNITMDLSNDSRFIPKLKSGFGIHTFLDMRLSTGKYPNGKVIGKEYDNYYRVYFISEVIEKLNHTYLLGQAEDIKSKTVYVLDLKKTAIASGNSFEAVKTTATHELLHAIGLYHTFDNDNLLTFKQFNTDNIMDYYDSSTNIKAKQTFKWQWDILKKEI